MTGQRRSQPEQPSGDAEPSTKPSEPPACSSGVHATQNAHPSDRPRSATWTVAEKFERDGYRYRLMRQPIAAAEAGPRLAPREEQAVLLAANGDNNKQIAEALGLAPSTVGVLLFRAANKFGVKTRRELLDAYRRLLACAADDES